MSNDTKAVKRPNSLRMTRKNIRRNVLAAVGATAIVSGAPAIAQEADDEIELGTLSIEDRTAETNPYAEADAPYKARVSGDSRRNAPIADTPATISVLTQSALSDAGTTDLRETLGRQPGITLGTGENGNAFGDRYIIRGFEARSDVFVDGLRDPGMTIRETFSVEQVEITKGPSSTFAGRGSTGGAVNSISKQASLDYDFSEIEVGVGTDDFRRLTVDANIPLSDTAAIRINGLHAYQEVPDRGPAERKRDGFAVSGVIEPTDQWSFVADIYHLNAQGDTDLGAYIDRDTGLPFDDIPVYLQEEDLLESEISVLTFRQGWAPSDTFRIENTMRFGETDNGYVLTGAGKTTRDATDPDAPGATSLSLSTHQGWQEVEYFVDQLNAYFDTTIGGMEHDFVLGAEWSELNVVNGAYSVTNTGATNCIISGRRGVQAGYCGLDGNGNTVSNLNTLMGREIVKGDQDSDYNVDTISLYLMDTIDVTDKFHVFAGLRMDSFDYANDVVARGGAELSYEYSDTLWNGHVGLVYDVTDAGNVYFTYSTSTNINGGESDVGSSCGYGGLCGDPDQLSLGEPERTTNLELGTKWNLFDEKFLATASIFQITKDDMMEGVNGADYTTLGTLNTGSAEVRGVEISLVGNITDNLSLQAGAAFMDSEITGSANTASIGSRLANFADNSATLQLRYQPVDSLAFGGSVTYSSDMGVGQPDSAASDTLLVPEYTVLDLFAEYDFNSNWSLRVNAGNVTDETYYTAAYRSGTFTYKGDARQVVATLNARF